MATKFTPVTDNDVDVERRTVTEEVEESCIFRNTSRNRCSCEPNVAKKINEIVKVINRINGFARETRIESLHYEDSNS